VNRVHCGADESPLAASGEPPSQQQHQQASPLSLGGGLVMSPSAAAVGASGKDVVKSLRFARVETKNLGKLLQFIKRELLPAAAGPSLGDGGLRRIVATGGGAHKYLEELKGQLGLEVVKLDEMDCLIKGSNFVLEVRWCVCVCDGV
jgi:type II pantothenate kinase